MFALQTYMDGREMCKRDLKTLDMHTLQFFFKEGQEERENLLLAVQ